MKVNFEYNREKDVWCLLTYGKRSLNSAYKTEVYKDLVSEFGENPNEEKASIFVDNYLRKKEINVETFISKYQERWNNISEEYQRIAEKTFGVKIPDQIRSYITVNNVCPYDIESDTFFVSFQTKSIERTAMHELWHFYTWYKFGNEWIEKLGNEKYNNIKESLTELLNTECSKLLPQGVRDNGYPQHQELRGKISTIWNEVRDIDKLWGQII